MTKMCERSRVKTLLQMPLADINYNEEIDALIEQASEDAELYTRRKFLKAARTEFYVSYDQAVTMVDPQIVLLDAFPVDLTQPLIVTWSPYDHVNDVFITLDRSNGDFTIEPEKGKIVMNRMGVIFTQNFPFLSGNTFTYAEKGFKIVYTGGYALNIPPDSLVPDPLDDFGVIQVPVALRQVIARKAASDYKLSHPTDTDFQKRGTSDPAAAVVKQFRQDLKPWTKKDMLF